MASMSEIRDQLASEGRIDSKKRFSFTTAKALPNGAWGLCGIGIRDDYLIIFDAAPGSLVGEVKDIMYEIPIREITNFKASNFALSRYMKFNWKDEAFHLTAFANNCGLNEAVWEILGK